MAPPFASSNVTLSCPLYACDFDPNNHDFLLVGGGGGEGRSGVGNKIVEHPSRLLYRLAQRLILNVTGSLERLQEV